jgi:Putative MetA-pathway of phenol degradation
MGTLAIEAKAYTCAADASTAIATDRPQVTNSSVVVPCGSLQFENGFQLIGNGGQRTLDLPETSMRLGIGGKTELRIGIPNYFNNSDTSSGFSNGFGDLSLGFKEQLGPTFGGFDVSVIPAVSIPTGAPLISSHGYDPTVQLPWSRGFAKNWTAAGMLSLMWPTVTGRRNLTGQSSFYIDRQLLQPLDAYVEYSGAFPRNGSPQHSIDFGMTYKPSPHQQVDFHCGFGLSASTPNYSIGLGYSVRFQAIPPR